MLVSTFQGSKPGKKHKLNYRQKCEIQDLVDLGDGYDETDPFVDNTEAVCIVMFITHSLPLKSSPFDRMDICIGLILLHVLLLLDIITVFGMSCH